MIQATYSTRGTVPQNVIEAVSKRTPTPGAGEVLVEVLAAPINPSDVLTLTGDYGILPPLPAVGGSEGVGRVAERGSDVTGLDVGQTVLLPPGGGTWSSHILAEAAALTPLPGEADPQQLAMLTVNPPTASLLLSSVVDLNPGDWVIQNAANSGVGTYLMQLAKLRGLKTINVVRREGAAEAIRRFEPDHIVVDGDDLAQRVADATGGAAVRLGIDAVGGTATDRLAGCLTPGGTVVNYGAMSGKPCVVTPANLIFRDITLTGFWLAAWYRTATAKDRETVLGELVHHITSGDLHAPVAATYPVEEIKAAVAAATQGERNGKILITPHH